jgi:predicted aspartyl protease
MGITYIDGVARGPTDKEDAVRFLIDRGATYSLLPTSVWQSIELEPTREQTFTLADGTAIQRRISTCYLMIPQGQDYSPVILGEPGDEALLGVVTLEILGLLFNPFNRTLQPMRMMLA